MLRSQQRFRSEADNIFTEKANKITLSSNDHKRLQTLDGIMPCSYGTSAKKYAKEI